VNQSVDAEPFRIDVPQAELDDLRLRLARTRWPIEPQGEAWRYGTPLHYLQSVVEHWQTRYDWRRWEAAFNRFPQYRARLGSRRIHFILERGSGPRPLPLLLTHGWPGSIAEFLEVIDPLAHPERHGGEERDAFTVVAPSLPGYGFSDPPEAPISQRQIAELWHELAVKVLGCTRYVAQAGDVGASVTSWLAFDHPENLAAIHINYMALQPQLTQGDPPVDDAERAWMAAAERRVAGETAYIQIQGTKPQTLSYGLTDSPVGLAAWILEKFHGWTVPGSDAPPPFDLDHLLTNIMLHWLGGPNAPTWTYLFTAGSDIRRLPTGKRVETPTGIHLFPQDITVPPPDRWIKRGYNLVHRTDAAKGGHFAAFENGPLFVDEVRRFFRAFR
jgi:microsomal epoxide hydrolase